MDNLRKYALFAVGAFIFVDLTLKLTLNEIDYDIIRPYTRPIMFISIVIYIGLWVTRKK